MREQIAEALGAFRGIYRNPNMRRLQLAAAGSVVGQYAFSIALAVYAYVEGGVAAVGLVAVIRTIPAALAAPFVSVLADRYRRREVMLVSDLIRSALIGLAAAVAFLGWSYWIVFVLAGLVRITSMAFRPAESALLPVIARTPEDLTAANVSASTIDALSVFVGPALGGLLLAATSPAAVFVATCGTYLWSALMIARIGADAEPDAGDRDTSGFWRDSAAGFSAIALEPRLRLLVGLYSAQTVVAGAEGVLITVAALELLGVGEGGYGLLNSAGGIGGLIGAFLVLVLARRKRMASDFGFGVGLCGASLLAIGVWPSPAAAYVAMGVNGVGNTLTDVNGDTLIQRTSPDHVLGRVFGVLNSALVGAMGIGALIAPILVETSGIRASLIVTGALLPVLTILVSAKLREVDRSADVPERELSLLRGVPIFAPLPLSTLEMLVRRLAPLHVDAGEEVFRAGDAGDRFYVVGAGEAEVLVDGKVKVEGEGGWFGEIALLHAVPRTATVRARTDVELLVLERDEFLAAVTGHAPSREVAENVVSERLGVDRPRIATI